MPPRVLVGSITFWLCLLQENIERLENGDVKIQAEAEYPGIIPEVETDEAPNSNAGKPKFANEAEQLRSLLPDVPIEMFQLQDD